MKEELKKGKTKQRRKELEEIGNKFVELAALLHEKEVGEHRISTQFGDFTWNPK